jgi:hypothetical protein
MRFFRASDLGRREFFRAATRYSLLGVLAVGGAVLGRRAAAQTCTRKGICPGCGLFTDCGLPAALSAKAAAFDPNQTKGRRL